MKPLALGFLAALTGLLSVAAANDVPAEPLVRFDAPATHFTQSCPLGNGRLGAMVFGGVEREHIQFNEESLWSGHPYDHTNSQAKAYLPQVRASVFDGQYDRAETYYREALAIAPDHRGATEYYGELMVERGDLPGARRMLARLETLCSFGCVESEDLRRWIEKGPPAS